MLPLTDGSKIMDLNQLLQRRQISLVLARDAACPESRISHEGLAALYASRITTLSRETGASVSLG